MLLHFRAFTPCRFLSAPHNEVIAFIPPSPFIFMVLRLGSCDRMWKWAMLSSVRPLKVAVPAVVSLLLRTPVP